jgi:predicted Zn-dependent protease
MDFSPSALRVRTLCFVSLLIIGSFIPLSAFATIALPEMGDPSGTILSVAEDQALGQEFMRNVRRGLTIIEDPEINGYINGLGYRLLTGAEIGQTQFTFFVVDAPQINAFAGPGGYIGIHSDLILAAETEGELAAVMAHEIAHVTQHHLARAFQKASSVNLQTAAAIIAAIILGGQNPQLGQAAIAASTAGSIQQQLNFTREHEKEADWVGIGILANAGYDPRDMPGFFEKLQQSLRYMESTTPELLRTHPVTANRIADSRGRAEQFPLKGDVASPNFSTIKAKLRVMTDKSPKERLKTLEQQMLGVKNDSELRYEYALTLLETGATDQARLALQPLLKENKVEIAYISASAQIDLRAGQAAQAKKTLEQALQLFPGHPTLITLLAKTELELKQPAAAEQLIRTLIQDQNQLLIPSYYHLLAQSQDQSGNSADAHISLAEYYYLIGQTRTAIEQLEIALHQIKESDTYRKERINARMDILKEAALEESRQH